ncbi:hypothetical protein [Bacillus sp. FJAT-49736]|uniref:hypothetical protein n=1 Tax=Bacillus sp. FJAT-49736 TaxID=2833582 RepID=UPI001BC9846F|nr:hypothetical protein [Bacillus sp. FJAT-49736]MBS4174713.1 hypothetical protein [Bacillus sp. FJAT-49736]
MNFKDKIGQLTKLCEIHHLQHISVLVKTLDNDYREALLSNGFEHKSSIVEYEKDLSELVPCLSNFQWMSLDDELSEEVFIKTWKESM